MIINSKRVCTTVRLLHLDFKKTVGEKAWWERYKDNACCLEKILEAAFSKTAIVRSLTFHFTNNPSKKNKTCWTLLEKQRRIH